VINPHPKEVTAPKYKLLFIDDDPAVIASLNLLLGDQYETFSASTVEAGLRLFGEIHPGVVLLDLRLPDRSGIDALREIRKIDLTAPVVILTGYSTRLAAEESLRLGATDYINKPFNANELTRKIERLALAGSIREKSQQLEHSIEDSVETLCEFREFQNASAAFLHDVASPLSSLMVGVDLLGQKLEEKNELEVVEISTLIEMMSGSVSYLRALVEQWRSFSEIHTLMHGKCEAASAVSLAVNQVKQQIHSASILLIIKSSREQLYIPSNDSAIARVLINLLKNAAEAVQPITGRIQLTTVANGKAFELTIADNGPGISPAVLDQIFLPRFSTKSSGKGLGLFISKKIIEAVGGTIKAQSPGMMGGADFIVTLPLV
jgi:signal transduction histidine kinase